MFGGRILKIGLLPPSMNLPRQMLVYEVTPVGKFMRGRVGEGGLRREWPPTRFPPTLSLPHKPIAEGSARTVAFLAIGLGGGDQSKAKRAAAEREASWQTIM